MTVAAGEADLSESRRLETVVRSGSAAAAVVLNVAVLVEEEEEQHSGSVSTLVSAWELEL